MQLCLCLADSFRKLIPSSRASVRERTLAKPGPQSRSRIVRGSSRSQSFSCWCSRDRLNHVRQVRRTLTVVNSVHQTKSPSPWSSPWSYRLLTFSIESLLTLLVISTDVVWYLFLTESLSQQPSGRQSTPTSRGQSDIVGLQHIPENQFPSYATISKGIHCWSLFGIFCV